MNRWWAFLLLPLLLGLPASSATVERLDHAALTGRAGRILWGDCVATRAEWNAERTRIFTTVRFARREVLKGEDEAVVEVKLPGGELDGRALVIHGMPRFEPGQEVVLFLTERHPRSGVSLPVGLGQGVFEVDRRGGRAVARRDTRGLELVTPGQPGGGDPGGLEELGLDELLAGTRAEVARQGGARGNGGRRP